MAIPEDDSWQTGDIGLLEEELIELGRYLAACSRYTLICREC